MNKIILNFLLSKSLNNIINIFINNFSKYYNSENEELCKDIFDVFQCTINNLIDDFISNNKTISKENIFEICLECIKEREYQKDFFLIVHSIDNYESIFLFYLIVFKNIMKTIYLQKTNPNVLIKKKKPAALKLSGKYLKSSVSDSIISQSPIGLQRFDDIVSPRPLKFGGISRLFYVYQRDSTNTSQWLNRAKVQIYRFSYNLSSLYYEEPEKGGRLISVNTKPSNTINVSVPLNSSLIPIDLLNEIRTINWLEHDDEYFVNVYQRVGKIHTKWNLVTRVSIPYDYKDKIKHLYYSNINYGGELLSVNGEPNFFNLQGKEVQGSEILPKAFLYSISRSGWWLKVNNMNKNHKLGKYTINIINNTV